jgi:hypothetical protein
MLSRAQHHEGLRAARRQLARRVAAAGVAAAVVGGGVTGSAARAPESGGNLSQEQWDSIFQGPKRSPATDPEGYITDSEDIPYERVVPNYDSEGYKDRMQIRIGEPGSKQTMPRMSNPKYWWETPLEAES